MMAFKETTFRLARSLSISKHQFTTIVGIKYRKSSGNSIGLISPLIIGALSAAGGAFALASDSEKPSSTTASTTTTLVDDINAPMAKRMEEFIMDLQDSICAAIEEEEVIKFKEDKWTREEGGGGRSRVLQDGVVFEKAGVNISVVCGTLPPRAVQLMRSR